MNIITWRDWWASRTIRFNAYMAAAWVGILAAFETGAVSVSMLGLSDVWEGRLNFIVGILVAVQNMRLRAKTSHPLHVRANVKPKGSANAFLA